MPINHFSSDLPEALWWTQQQPMMEPTQKTQSSKHTPLISNHPNTTLWSNSNYPLYDHHHVLPSTATASMFCGQNTGFNLNLSQEDAEELDEPLTDIDNLYHQQHHHHHHQQQQQQELEREPMFEKPLTPSDVGKLNRLVIPKQHAEKYFPLGGSESVEKGLLLSFEDESGKCWRFRYSYWTSSQSYVLTKGWSRYVKEKRLNAGDVVLFERHRSEGDRLFIGWRRGAATASGQDNAVAQPAGAGTVVSNIGGGWTRPFYSAHPYPSHPHGHGSPLPYQTDCLHAESVMQQQTTPSGNSKKLRLFGVNLECQLDESEQPTPDGSSMSSQGQALYQYYPEPHASNRHDHMDANFSRDVNQMRYRQG